MSITREEAILIAQANAQMGQGTFEVINECAAELGRAMRKHPPIRGPHEGYAVILEEMDELWAEIKRQATNPEALRKEAVQVAAMAMRFLVDVCNQAERARE